MYQLATNVWHGQTYARGTRVTVVNDNKVTAVITVRIDETGPDKGREIECFYHEIELSPASH